MTTTITYGSCADVDDHLALCGYHLTPVTYQHVPGLGMRPCCSICAEELREPYVVVGTTVASDHTARLEREAAHVA